MPTGLEQITHLTFDCYGTLIDWEAGILQVLQPLLSRYGFSPASQQILEWYVANEATLEALPWKPYHLILREIVRLIGENVGIKFRDDDLSRLPDSVGSWAPFPDTVPALRALQKRFRLVILSNIDDAMFSQTAARLSIPFDGVITAEQVRSYKPREAHFHEALRRLKITSRAVLHVAQSLYHDHAPATRLGFHTAWVKRPSLLLRTGLAPAASISPDMEVGDLAELAAMLLR